MTVEVKVPILPESVADAIIATWHKKPGDAVKREENLVDLETDKVVLEVPSPVDGVLVSIVKNTGDSVTSQELIATIQEGAVAAAAPAAAAPAAAAPAASDQAPSVRRIAAETGIDPASVDGTGRGGRVTKEDMLKAQAPAPAAAPSASKAVATTTQASTAIAVPPGARAEQRVPMTRGLSHAVSLAVVCRAGHVVVAMDQQRRIRLTHICTTKCGHRFFCHGRVYFSRHEQ